MLASCTLDDMVKIIDVSTLEKRIKEDDFDEELYEANVSQNLKANHGKIKIQPENGNDKNDEDNWQSDSDNEDMSDSDDDSSSDDENNQKNKKKDKELNPKNATLQATKKMMEDKHRKDFFDDL